MENLFSMLLVTYNKDENAIHYYCTVAHRRRQTAGILTVLKSDKQIKQQ